jgi:outer membrane protein W
MKKSNITVLILILVVLTLVISMATSASAHEEPAEEVAAAVDQPKVRDWTLRFGFVVAETDGSTSVITEPGTVDISLSTGGGGFALLERKVSPLVGLEFGSTALGLETNVSTHAGVKHYGSDVDFVSMGALTFGVNFHFVRTPSVIVYAGPLLAYNRYSKWSVYAGCDDHCWPAKHGDDYWVSVQSRSDSEFSWGGKIGLDIILTKRGNWALSGSLSFIDASYDFGEDSGTGSSSIDVDPLMFSFGGGFRF